MRHLHIAKLASPIPACLAALHAANLPHHALTLFEDLSNGRLVMDGLGWANARDGLMTGLASVFVLAGGLHTARTIAEIHEDRKGRRKPVRGDRKA